MNATDELSRQHFQMDFSWCFNGKGEWGHGHMYADLWVGGGGGGGGELYQKILFFNKKHVPVHRSR